MRKVQEDEADWQRKKVDDDPERTGRRGSKREAVLFKLGAATREPSAHRKLFSGAVWQFRKNSVGGLLTACVARRLIKLALIRYT